MPMPAPSPTEESTGRLGEDLRVRADAHLQVLRPEPFGDQHLLGLGGFRGAGPDRADAAAEGPAHQVAHLRGPCRRRPPHRSSMTRSIMLSTKVTPQALMTCRSTGASRCGRAGSRASDALTTSAVVHRGSLMAGVEHAADGPGASSSRPGDGAGQAVQVEHVLAADRHHPRPAGFDVPDAPDEQGLRRRPPGGREAARGSHARVTAGPPPLWRQRSGAARRRRPAAARSTGCASCRGSGSRAAGKRLVGHGPQEAADGGRPHRGGGRRRGRVGAAVVLGVADGDARGPAVPEHPAADVGQPGGELGDVVVRFGLQRGGQLPLQQSGEGRRARIRRRIPPSGWPGRTSPAAGASGSLRTAALVVRSTVGAGVSAKLPSTRTSTPSVLRSRRRHCR